MKVLEEKGESVAPGTLLGTSHTYVIKTGTQEKTGAKRVSSLLLHAQRFVVLLDDKWANVCNCVKLSRLIC